MAEQLQNLARSTLSAGIDDVTDPITLAVQSADGVLFPSIGTFRIVVTDGVNHEIMLATARTGDLITATRAQEGTTIHAFNAGVTVAHILTAEALRALIGEHTGDTSDAHLASSIEFVPAGSIAATDVQAAVLEAASEGGGALDGLDAGMALQDQYDGGSASSAFAGGGGMNGGTA